MASWVFNDNSIEIKQELEGVPVSVLRIMKNRGITEDKFEDFLSPKPKCTYDPFLLSDLRQACEKILRACDEKIPVCVYGDYDADGVTSTALMLSLIRLLGGEASYYIPSRFTDGYGPNTAAIKRIADNGIKLLITVDCGITSRSEMQYAESLGMECIVTDHHILRDGMTPECLTVNPHKKPGEYPFEDLSGCGVAFKIAQGLQRMCEEREDNRFTKKQLNEFLDLVAISTVADVVPLLDENRCLVKYGLDRINKREREGLRLLVEELSLDGVITADSISFVIAPNINAQGRMDKADRGVELLISDKSGSELRGIARTIIDTNRRRKQVQEDTMRICSEALEKENCGEYAPVIFAPGAHEGVAGIVAGNLKESFGKPVCIVSPAEDGSLKGTGRSVAGLNLHRLFEGCSEVFERFGGHAGACGFTVKPGRLEEFREKLQKEVEAEIEADPELLEKTILIEKELDTDEKSIEFAEALSLLEPFGEANPCPLFCIRNVKASDIRLLGGSSQHLKFTADSGDGKKISCIFFGGADFEDMVRNSAIDVAGEFGINEFRGSRQIQLKVVDIRKSA